MAAQLLLCFGRQCEVLIERLAEQLTDAAAASARTDRSVVPDCLVQIVVTAGPWGPAVL